MSIVPARGRPFVNETLATVPRPAWRSRATRIEGDVVAQSESDQQSRFELLPINSIAIETYWEKPSRHIYYCTEIEMKVARFSVWMESAGPPATPFAALRE